MSYSIPRWAGGLVAVGLALILLGACLGVGLGMERSGARREGSKVVAAFARPSELSAPSLPRTPESSRASLSRRAEHLSSEYVKLYKEAAREYGFSEDWYVLAAVGKVETKHGTDTGRSSAGARGPMQFVPSTWETFGVDGDGDGTANIMDPEDAIPAAARYLEAKGAPEDWRGALYSYNRTEWYVEDVLAAAERYRRLDGEETEPDP